MGEMVMKLKRLTWFAIVCVFVYLVFLCLHFKPNNVSDDIDSSHLDFRINAFVNAQRGPLDVDNHQLSENKVTQSRPEVEQYGNIDGPVKKPTMDQLPQSTLVSKEDPKTTVPLDKKAAFKATMKHQEEVINKFCAANPSLASLPIPYNWLLFDDKYKVVYCFVPKVGCTVLKQLIMTLRGIFKPGENPPHYSIHIKYYATLLSKVTTPSERERKLKEYFKFMFLRDPMERLLSGYIDKLEIPLSSDKRAFDPIKKEVMNHIKGHKRGSNPDHITNKNGTDMHYIEFEEYLDYLTWMTKSRLNEHFKPMYMLCNPCQVKYDYYGHFGNLTEESYQIMDHLNIPRSWFPVHPEHKGISMKELMDMYYGDMSAERRKKYKKELFEKSNHPFVSIPDAGVSRDLLKKSLNSYSTEFDFYRSLFPKSTDTILYYLNTTLT